jgi:hypothetical protein
LNGYVAFYLVFGVDVRYMWFGILTDGVTQAAKFGVVDYLIRISVGAEDEKELVGRFRKALEEVMGSMNVPTELHEVLTHSH